MPRTKGAKNKINVKELQAKLDALEKGSKPEQKAADPIQADQPPSAEKEKEKNDKDKKPNSGVKAKANNRGVVLELDLPKSRAKSNDMPEKPNQTTGSFRSDLAFKCGVKICGYSQATPFSPCPNCGANLEWSNNA